jgi:hypothetical protein
LKSPPINLGQTGLTLAVRLYFQAAGAAPVNQSVVGVTVPEIGSTGDYYIAGLADPEAGVTAVAVIYEAASPALALYTFSYGAGVPAASIVWRHAVQPAAPTQRIVAGDTYGSLSLVVTEGLPEEIEDAAVTFTLFDVGLGTVLIEDEAAAISNVTEDGGGNGYGCTLTYTIQDGDTDTPGSCRGRFSITYPGGMGVQTVPADDSMRVEVVEGYGS